MSHAPSVDLFAPVAIVGAGPTGLSLALGLARHGVRSILLERELSTSEYSKAPGIHVRTREVFRQWGIEERFLNEGTLVSAITLHSAIPGRRPLYSIDFSELKAEVDQPGVLFLEQGHTERLLLEAVRESEMCDVRFGAEAIGLAQDENVARLTFREAEQEHSLNAEFVVGCDGASSFVRPALDLSFDGITYSLQPMLADVRVKDKRDNLAWPRFWNGPQGIAFALRLSPQLWRIVSIERGKPVKEEVSDEEVSRRVDRLLGKGPAEVVWSSRFRIHRRSSPRFRVGRVLLAGDAAHIHSPTLGFGMNAGIQDAHNLAWKLAYTLSGGDVDRLLDSYEVERRAIVVESVSRYTDVLTRIFLQTPVAFRAAAFSLNRMLLKSGRIRRRILRRMTMINLDYPPSPILDRQERSAGIRLPNPVLRTQDGKNVRLYDLLPNGPAIIDVAKARDFSPDLPVKDIVQIGPGAYLDPTGLISRLLGGTDGWVLVRPDTHVAWARTRLQDLDNAIQHALGHEVHYLDRKRKLRDTA